MGAPVCCVGVLLLGHPGISIPGMHCGDWLPDDLPMSGICDIWPEAEHTISRRAGKRNRCTAFRCQDSVELVTTTTTES